MTEVNPAQRGDILCYAARLTVESGDSQAVVINAGPLLAWAEQAGDADDLRVRLRALMHYSANCAAAASSVAVLACADDPSRFLEGAKVLYAFATAGMQA